MRLKEIGIEEWAERIKGYPRVSLFHTCEWLKILKDGFTHTEIKLYAVLDEKNMAIGLLPIEVTQKGPFKVGGSPLPGLFTPYQGPLLLNFSESVLGGMLKLTTQLVKPRYFALSLPSDGEGRKLVGSGWELKKTIVVNLTLGSEQLWKNFKAETRNQVRQAERQGVEIYEPKVLDDWLADYYAMHEAVYSRQRMKAPAKPAFYRALWRNLHSEGQLKVILAKHKGKTIAGGIFPVYKDTIYFLDGASFREQQKLRGNNLIQWHTISWAASEGLRVYDMVGANIPSIAHFKSGFGGAEVEYPYFQMAHGFLGGIGYHLYQRYRPWIKRLGI